MTVAFSGTFGYILAPIKHEPLGIFLISLAGFLLTGAANIVNQLKEIPYDKLMKRTANRPLPTETLNSKQASIFGYILVVAALALLSYFSWKSAALGFLSYLLYGYVYTPLKRVGPISVFVGAFPGAFPPMIGWVAATEHFGWEPGILFPRCISADDWLGCRHGTFRLGTRDLICHSVFLAISSFLGDCMGS